MIFSPGMIIVMGAADNCGPAVRARLAAHGVGYGELLVGS